MEQADNNEKLENMPTRNVDEEISKLIEKLDDVVLFGKNERLKNKIIKYLNILKENSEKFYENFDKMREKLQEIVKLPEDYANQISIEVEDKFDAAEVKSLLNYLDNRTLQLSNWCNKKSTFDDLFESAGINISNDFKLYLINKTFDSTPSIGKTEILFSIIFNKGRRPSSDEHGDVRVNGNAVEVKGQGARLGGQRGYSKGFLVVKYFKDWFKVNNPDLKKDIDSYDNQSFNFNITNFKNYQNSFLKLCGTSNIELDKAKEIFKNGIKEMYTNEKEFQSAFNEFNFIDDFLIKTSTKENNEETIRKAKEDLEALVELNDKKKIKKQEKLIAKLEAEHSSNANSETLFKIKNTDDFFNTFLCFSLRYYQLIEKFEYLAVVNGKEFIILNNESLNDKEKIVNSINLMIMPNFSTNAGEQGAKTAISLK